MAKEITNFKQAMGNGCKTNLKTFQEFEGGWDDYKLYLRDNKALSLNVATPRLMIHEKKSCEDGP